MSEQRTFVFGVTFIILFSAFVATIPIGLLGLGGSGDNVTPLDPALVTGFSESENFMRPNFTGSSYEYDLNDYTWLCIYNNDSEYFQLGSKQLIFGWLWLGGMDYVTFIDDNNTDRGLTLSMSEIEANAVDGFARYSLQYAETGNSAGTWIIYWNDTAYSDPQLAWLADALYITHGVGLETNAAVDLGNLLLRLLFLQLPDVPLLINLIIIAPVWASVIYLIWYIIKEMIPFL